MADRDGVVFKVDGVPLQAERFTPPQSIKCAEQDWKFQLGSFGNLKELIYFIGIIEASDEAIFFRAVYLVGGIRIRSSFTACFSARWMFAW